MRAKVESAEVLYAKEAVITVDGSDVARLKREAEGNARRRIRLCAHRSVDDRLHEMLIVHTKDTYVRPHKHLGKSESFHVIEGSVDVVLFDEGGAVADVIAMGEYQSGRPFYYRIATPAYHTLLIRSDVLVFHETTNGPFHRAETVFAPWAPEDGDSRTVEGFLAALEAQLVGRSRRAGAER